MGNTIGNHHSSSNNSQHNLQQSQNGRGLGKYEHAYLAKMFEGLASRCSADHKTIDKETFLRYFQVPGILGDRMFTVFDKDHNNAIDFNEFLDVFRTYLTGSVDAKIRLLFQMYDLTGNDAVSCEELRTMLMSVVTTPQMVANLLEENSRSFVHEVDEVQDDDDDDNVNGKVESNESSVMSISSDENETAAEAQEREVRETIDHICKNVFKAYDLGHKGLLDYDAFRRWTRNNPKMLTMLEKGFARHVWKRPDFTKAESSLRRLPAMDDESDDEEQFACGSCEFKMRFCPGCGADIVTNITASGCPLFVCKKKCGNAFHPHHGLLTYCPQCGSPWDKNPCSEPQTPHRVDWREKFQLRSPRAEVSSVHGRGLLYKGWLRKLRRHLKTFKLSYYVLRHNFLYQFDDDEALQPTKVLFLEGLFIEVPTDDDHARNGLYGFTIYGAEDVAEHTYYANSEQERQEWVKYLRQSAKHFMIDDFYQIGRQVGTGRFATVHRVTRISDRKEFAVKVIDKSKVDDSVKDAMRAEIAILKLVHHPHIIRFIEVFESASHLFIVLDLVRGGDLLAWLKEHGTMPERDVRTIVYKVLQALDYLHCRGIVHRDIKPENILLGDTFDTDRRDIYLADFGLSRFATPEQTMKIACGTLSYMAPEVLLLQGYTQQVDLWGCGVLAFMLLSGCKPFYNENRDTIIDLIVDHPVQFKQPVWRTVSAEAIEFISRLLDKDPTGRMGIHEAFHHSWFSKHLSTPAHGGSMQNLMPLKIPTIQSSDNADIRGGLVHPAVERGLAASPVSHNESPRRLRAGSAPVNDDPRMSKPML